MKAFAIVCGMIGLLLAPGYYLYCDLWSGKTIGTFRTGEQFELDPQMNPVAITITVSHSRGDSEYYSAALYSGARTIATTSFSTSKDAGTTSSTLRTDISQRGPHQVLVAGSRSQNRALALDFKVRRNARVVDWRVVAAGIVMMVIASFFAAKTAE